jgi:hypothetical protein
MVMEQLQVGPAIDSIARHLEPSARVAVVVIFVIICGLVGIYVAIRGEVIIL